MFSFKKMVLTSAVLGIFLAVHGLLPDAFEIIGPALAVVNQTEDVSVIYPSDLLVICTAGPIRSSDPIPASASGDIANGLTSLFDTEVDESDDVANESTSSITSRQSLRSCGYLTGHFHGVESIKNQMNHLAKWSDISSQDDDRFVSVMRRVGVLNDEREALYRHLDDCLAGEKITPNEHELISSTWIVPAWRNLADASTLLDKAIAERSANNSKK